MHAIITFYLYGEEVSTSNKIHQIATVKYVCSYMTKGEKGMGETLKSGKRVLEMMQSEHK